VEQLRLSWKASWNKAWGDLTDPFDRLSEVAFGVIMALTIISVIPTAADGAGRQQLVLAALGCNLAWGIVDALMTLVGMRVDREHRHAGLRILRQSKDEQSFRDGLREFLPDRVVDHMQANDVQRMRQNLLKSLLGTGDTPKLGREHWLAWLVLACHTFVATFPIILPLLLIHDDLLALRLAQGTGLVLLFGLGWLLARWAGGRPWQGAVGFAALGVAMTGICLALGG
jgi:VIT1/CCC1 family predicted Fe2+/Mn2+ transporter